ncbi:MAG: hypothetical protein RR334_01570 [Clostridia bacterium]
MLAQHNNMKEIMIVILIISITIVIFLLKIPFRLQFHGDALVFKGFYCIKVGFFNLLCGRFLLSESADFIVENKNNNISKINIKTSLFTKKFITKLLQRISYRSLDCYVHFGINDDPAKTAIITACLNNVMDIICIIVKRKNINFVCDSNIIMERMKDTLELTIQLKLSVSVLDVIVSLIYGLKWENKKV